MARLDALEIGRRIRAARAYADLAQPDLADKLGISLSTVKRLERGQKQPRNFEAEPLQRAVAEACGLPYEWFTADLQKLALADGEGSRDRTDEILRKLDAVLAYRERFNQLEEDVTMLTATVREVMPLPAPVREAQTQRGRAAESPSDGHPQTPAEATRARRSSAR